MPRCRHDPPRTESCQLCWLWENDDRYRRLWEGKKHRVRTSSQFSCVYLGKETGEEILCPTCNGAINLKLLTCEIHGKCTVHKELEGIKCCRTCKDKAKVRPMKIKWSYGITTVPNRKDDLFPKTLQALKESGFDSPRLFIDGEKDASKWSHYELEVTTRYPTIRTYGNWVLSLAELYIREPTADRYAIFQDDITCSRNLRQYLDKCTYPEKGYWNLCTYPSNATLAPEGKVGWYLSNQYGRGAQALVFNREAVISLLSNQHMVERPLDARRGHKSVDGGVVTALKKVGYKEYVHNPSLIYHTGRYSSMGNKPQPDTALFRGEEFDLLSLLN